MSYTIKITPEAQTDIRETISYYNEQKSGLGKRFFGHLGEAMKLLENNPKLFQVRYRNVRQVGVKGFPIQVHYIIDEKERLVIVITALHSSRNPQIWKNRS